MTKEKTLYALISQGWRVQISEADECGPLMFVVTKTRRHNNDLQTSISADRRGNFNFEDEKGLISYMLKMFKWHRDNGAPA